MDVRQIRAEGHRVQRRHLGGQDAALQSRVDGLHLGLPPILLLEDRHHGIPQGGVLAVLPGGVVPPAGEGPGGGQGLELLHQGLLFRGRAAAHAPGQAQRALLQPQDAQVQGRADLSGQIRLHGLHAVGGGEDELQGPAAVLCGEGPAGPAAGLGQGAGCAGELARQGLPEGALQEPAVRPARGQEDPGLGLAGDGVVLLPAVEGDEPDAGQAGQAPGQHPVGVGNVLVDLRAGVAAGQAGYGEGKDIAGGGLRRERDVQVAPGASGTAHGEDPLGLGVDVQQVFALEIGAVQGRGSQQADLLVHREHRLQGRVGDGVIIQHGHGHGHGNAVVAAQGGAPGPDPVPVHHQLQAVLGEVVVHAGLGNAHHVQMALEHHRRVVLIARRGVLPDDHVARLVPAVTEAPGLGEVHRPVTGGGGVPRAVGDGAQLLEKAEHALRLQVG